MQTASTRLETLDRFWFFWLPLATAVAIFLALTIWVRVSLGQGRPQATYASPEEASQALYEAVQNENKQAILQILGGRKELAISDDPQDDKAARKLFAAKFKEMHRFVRQSDRRGELAVPGTFGAGERKVVLRCRRGNTRNLVSPDW